MADGRRFQASWRSVSRTPSEILWMVVCYWRMLTLSVLMVQGGVRDLLDGAPPSGSSAYFSFGTTIFGGGLLAGCVALVMNRLR